MDGRAGRWSAAAAGMAAVAMVAMPAPAAAACAGAGRSADALSVDDARSAIRCVVGEERREAGRQAWADDARLDQAAGRHADDMVERDYFAHESPGGRSVLDRIARTGWPAGRARWRAGEVLAWGAGRRSTPRALVTSWMTSPGHRRILLDDGLEVAGVGVARGAPGRGSRTALTVALVAAA